MNNWISTIRISLRKYPIFFIIAKQIYRPIVLIKYTPTELKHICNDYRKMLSYEADGKKTAWFLCVPKHANLGDQAMAYAIRKWIREKYPNYNLVELTRESIKFPIFSITTLMKRKIAEEDIIFFQGGYTSGNKTTNEVVHRIVAKKFKNNRIIFFPQTVFYTNERQKKKTANIYNQHGRILFLARDNISYNTVKSVFNNIQIRVWPDVVSSLIGRNEIELKDHKKDVLMCIRNDSEKKYGEKQIEEIKEELEKEYGYMVDIIDLMKSEDEMDNDWYWDVIRKTIQKMSEYKVVVTDRFHGILFAILAETRVAVLDSIDFKVREGAFMFGTVFPDTIKYIENPSDAGNIVYELYNKEVPPIYDDKCYNEYYAKLDKLVELL